MTNKVFGGLWVCGLLFLASCAYQGVNQYPLSAAYPRYEALLGSLNELSREYPGVFQHRIIGFSGTENLPIYAVELGKGERNILIIGQHHADEMLGVAISLHLVEELSRAYLKDAKVKALLDEYRLWIVPSINPEGWRVVSSGLSRIKRKNNRDTDGNKKFDLRTDGVDLNRNYPIFWDLDGETNHMSSFYKGPAPASEQEVKAIIALGRRISFELAIFYHSSLTGALSERIFLPAVTEESPEFMQLRKLAEEYAKQSPRDYHRGTYRVQTGTSSRVGNARNFFWHALKVPAMLIEVGGVNRQGQSIIHPGEKMVKRISKRHTKALLSLLEYNSGS
jgi:hypothetical protein